MTDTWPVLEESTFDEVKKEWTHRCGSVVMGAKVAHSVWDKRFACAGGGEVQYETVPYCPTCQEKPSFYGGPGVGPFGASKENPEEETWLRRPSIVGRRIAPWSVREKGRQGVRVLRPDQEVPQVPEPGIRRELGAVLRRGDRPSTEGNPNALGRESPDA